MPLSRRSFIHLVGKAGGAAAAYRTMVAMGLLAEPAAYAGPPELAPGSGRGVRVVILGAGIAGMVAANELRKAGYYVMVLEARSRPGGRTWTLRGGGEVRETDSRQGVAWDEGDHMYFDPGPARMPYHHEGILGYCRDLDVPVEVTSNDNRAAYYQDDAVFDGKPQRARAVMTDVRGFVAELAAKAIDKGALGADVSKEDLERVRALLKSFGALDGDLAYKGSARAGYADPPGAGTQVGTPTSPLDVRQILRSSFWSGPMALAEAWSYAPTMLQPVGGMGRLAHAFGRALGPLVTYEAAVTEIHKTASGARVVWKDRRTGAPRSVETPWVLCTIPLPVLRNHVSADFAPDVQRAVNDADYLPAVKIAFQADRRFWEIDHQIYGGISWTERDIAQIWYPSAGLHRKKGILVGAYIWSGRTGSDFTNKTPEQRLAAAIDSGERVHPGYAREVGRGVSVAWAKIPWSQGAWADWSRTGSGYTRLLAGDGPILFAGEHLSHLPGWQEGAVRSAHLAVAELGKRVAAKRA